MVPTRETWRIRSLIVCLCWLAYSLGHAFAETYRYNSNIPPPPPPRRLAKDSRLPPEPIKTTSQSSEGKPTPKIPPPPPRRLLSTKIDVKEEKEVTPLNDKKDLVISLVELKDLKETEEPAEAEQTEEHVDMTIPKKEDTSTDTVVRIRSDTKRTTPLPPIHEPKANKEETDKKQVLPPPRRSMPLEELHLSSSSKILPPPPRQPFYDSQSQIPTYSNYVRPIPNVQVQQPQYYSHHYQQQQTRDYSNQPYIPQRQPQSQRANQIPNTRQGAGRTGRTLDLSKTNTALKSLWGRVEKGLDELVRVEDYVADRAHKMVSSARSRAHKMGATSSLSAREHQQEGKLLEPTTIQLKPYGDKYAVAKRQQEEKQAGVQPNTWNASPRKPVLVANGGASTPPSQSVAGPGQTPPATDQNPPPASGQPVRPESQLPRSPPIAATSTSTATSPPVEPRADLTSQRPNPPFQSHQNVGSPPKPPAVGEPHSRASRIPWDTSASTKPAYVAPTARPDRSELTFEEDKKGIFSRALSALPSLPRLSSIGKLFRFRKRSSYEYASMDAWNNEDDEAKGGFFGLFRRETKSASTSSDSKQFASKPGNEMAPPLASLMERCHDGKTNSLLSRDDEARCRGIGRSKAIFDIACLSFILLGVQQIDGLSSVPIPSSFVDFQSNTLPLIRSLLQDAVGTWMPIFFGYAYLAVALKRSLLGGRAEALERRVGAQVEDESLYAQLYLRLAAAVPMKRNMPSDLNYAAAKQATGLVSMARLNAFVTMILASLVIMTVSMVGPVFTAIIQSLLQIFGLRELRSFPIAWKPLFAGIQEAVQSLAHTLEGLFATGLSNLLESPVKFAFHVAIFASLVLVSMIPRIEVRRKADPKKTLEDEDDDENMFSSTSSAEQVSKLGASSASRLSMLSENGSIESALEHWRNGQDQIEEEDEPEFLMTQLRRFAYVLLAAMLATMPLLVSLAIGMSKWAPSSHLGLEWDSLLDVSLVMGGVFFVATSAISSVMQSTSSKATVEKFLSVLTSTIEELRQKNRSEAGIQFMTSVSPTAGLVVNDLWAAFTTKRAWAVRGASFQCKNGEILVVLGDDGAGKTRLLTTIAETLIDPPRRSLTSNKVRGYVGICGVEGTKWDKSMLKRRLGVMLSDITTVADAASLYSGWTMEEILEPVDGLATTDPNHSLDAGAKSSIVSALKITGLYSSLIPRLPSKLSTVLTAHEEDMRPSVLRPRNQVLSPAEWSKLILTKILAQTIYDNENAAATPDKVENSMVGSVLLLDDPTVLLSEVEEAKVMKELRQTGAATIMTTNKWATGRFADQIVVVKDGAIVERGTHNELLSRGPQQSLYAAKWHAMTVQ